MTTADFHRVFVADPGAEVGIALVGAQSDAVHVFGRTVTDIDRRIRGAPHDPILRRPARGGEIAVGLPALEGAGNHPAGVGAEDGVLVFDQLLPGDLIGSDFNGAGANHADRLEVLRSHHPAQAACRMGTAGHDVGQPAHRLSALADGGHVAIGAHDALNVSRGAENPVPPHVAGVPDFDDVVVDIQPGRFGCFALDDDGIIAGIFQLGTPVPPHMPGSGQLIRMGRPERGNRHAAG